jgi:biopolymer transport protein ExbD
MRIAGDLSTPRRGVSLTPMIDVVFLLLVFFMLASRFGAEHVLPLASASGEAQWEGPPRLIEVYPDALRLNGGVVSQDALIDSLAPLMPGPDSPVVLRARGGADIGRIAAVMGALNAAGYPRLVLVE